MIATVASAALSGLYHAPPSKSDAHRGLICAALSNGFSHVSPLSSSMDIEATIAALASFDSKIQFCGDTALVQGISGSPTGHVRIFCNESGSTLRFLIPIAAAYGIEAVFTGAGHLPKRPLLLYHQEFAKKGVTLTRFEADELPLRVSGRLLPGQYTLAGDVSSQFITGLLLALPLLQGDSELVISTALQSRPYVDMTVSTLARFGVRVIETSTGYVIPGWQQYIPCTYVVEGDYSNAAFFAVAGALCKNGISIAGLDPSSHQGDREIFALLRRFGAQVTQHDSTIVVSPGSLHGIAIDASQIPDLVPILAVLGACASGQTHIYNAHRLKMKESDRLASTTQLLQRLGADACSDGEGALTLYGGKCLHGGVVDACNDHRIAMSAAIAALVCSGPVMIEGAECVTKSYPTFFEDYNRLGGHADVNLGESIKA